MMKRHKHNQTHILHHFKGNVNDIKTLTEILVSLRSAREISNLRHEFGRMFKMQKYYFII